MTQTTLLPLSTIIASVAAWGPQPTEPSAVPEAAKTLLPKLPNQAYMAIGQVRADLAEAAILAAYGELRLPEDVEAPLMANFIVTTAAERPAANRVRAEVHLEPLVSMIALAQPDRRHRTSETRAAIRERIVANAGSGDLPLATALRVIMAHRAALGLDYGSTEDQQTRLLRILDRAAHVNTVLGIAISVRSRFTF